MPSTRQDTVLRELPISIGANVPDGIPRDRPQSPVATTMLDISSDMPLCSAPDMFLYGTSAGSTRRRLNLDSLNQVEPSTSLILTPPATPTSTTAPKRPAPMPTRSSPRKKKVVLQSPQIQEVSVEEVLLWVQNNNKHKTEEGAGSSCLDAGPSCLERRLSCLSPQQLSEVISGILERHPEVEKDLYKLLPEPDIQYHIQQVSELLHSVYRSLPRQRLSSSRSAFCYRRVKSHIFAFKKYCIQQGRQYLACEAWKAAVEYSLLAWQHAQYLPKWESPAHNKLKAGCIRGLASICVEALGGGHFSAAYRQDLRPRIATIATTSSDFVACLRKLDSINNGSS